MTETQIEKKAPRDRSPSFPFISLKTAIMRLTEFEQKFGRQEAPADRVYLAWGMKGDTSQAQQTLAALKAFGLVEYRGTGPKRLVAISDDARTYLRAQQESVQKQVLKKVALTPRWIAHFWPTWGSSRGPDEVCLDALVLTHKFNQNAAPNFLTVYDETITYAGLSGSDKTMVKKDASGTVEEDDLPPPAIVKVGDFVQWTSKGIDQFNPPRRVVGIFPDGSYVKVFGSNSGIPMAELTVVDPPAPPPPGTIPGAAPGHIDAGSAWGHGENAFNVLQAGGRLQITADVNLEGLEELKAMLTDYENILKRLAARKKS